MTTTKTIVGRIDSDILSFTVGKDPILDVALAEADCLGSAAHVEMLSRIPLKKRLFTPGDVRRIKTELVKIMRMARKGAFSIRAADQDVHMAVERALTRKLGDLGKRIHTARSRNDQVAVDLRLFAKEQLLGAMEETVALANALLKFAGRNIAVPMVGRTHMQPAMPSSVGLWASAHAESLIEDLELLGGAYRLNDRCPLGSAAGYGVPLKIDRGLTSRLLGFEAPIHNVLYASHARGKIESVVLSALSQVMLSLSRLAEDLILYSMPEFGYFRLPDEYGTGSSLMPQKKNPDALELVRAKASKVLACAFTAAGIVKGLPGGYNRDLQEIKEPFMEGIRTTRSSLTIMALLVGGVGVNKPRLLAGFSPAVFAADRALELAAEGLSFRDAYDYVKGHLDELKGADPFAAAAMKKHLGGPAGLNLGLLSARANRMKTFVNAERSQYHRTISKLLGVRYPKLG